MKKNVLSARDINNRRALIEFVSKVTFINGIRKQEEPQALLHCALIINLYLALFIHYFLNSLCQPLC